MKTDTRITIAWIFATLLITVGFYYMMSEEFEYPKKEETNTEQLGYNPKTDAYINSILNQEDSSMIVYIDNNYAGIRYEQLQIDVYYSKFIPYKQQESWFFHCVDKNGKVIMIQSCIGIAKHNVSPETLERIKEIYKQYHKK